MFGQRILLLIAHPDDEIVGCAAAIARARATGATIFGLYLTHGCLSRDTLWRWQRGGHDKAVATRRAEAEAAAQLLGIDQAGWSPRPARYLWREMDTVAAEIATAVDHVKPDQIWTPAFEGGNPDHDALNAIASLYRARLSVLEFAEYHYAAGKAQSNSFIAPDAATHILTLLPDETAAKRAALGLYTSERGNLSSIQIAQESFRPLGPYDYTKPPHPGKLWYNRFQWVPFKHPRVDYTDPADVTAAIVSFLEKANSPH